MFVGDLVFILNTNVDEEVKDDITSRLKELSEKESDNSNTVNEESN